MSEDSSLFELYQLPEEYLYFDQLFPGVAAGPAEQEPEDSSARSQPSWLCSREQWPRPMPLSPAWGLRPETEIRRERGSIAPWKVMARPESFCARNVFF